MPFQIVEGEGTVDKDIAATRLAKAWDFDRIGKSNDECRKGGLALS